MKRTLFLAAALMALACSSEPTSPIVDAGTDAGQDAGNNQADAGMVAPPATPVGDQLTWVLSVLNGAPVTSTDVQAHFSGGFLGQVPAASVLTIFQQLSAVQPWTLVGFEGGMTSTGLTAVVTRGDGEYWRIELHVDSSQNNEIDGLLLSPAGDLDPSLTSFDAVEQAMKAVAPTVDLLAATIDANGCTPIQALNPNTNLALGSAFKLWVLATLAQSVDTGAHSWMDMVPIQDQYKSLPSGVLQNEPNGEMLSLETYAEEMISISDNTAADHLLFTLGRDAVEAMLTTTGHHDPMVDQPFLSTRELFDLKLMLSASDQEAYIAASSAQKRSLLGQYDMTLDPRTYRGGPWVNPIHIDTMEWFATPKDLCNVMRTLKSYGDKPATSNVYKILSINPGLADPSGKFAYIGYKGGSEPGVLTLNWLLKRSSDGAWLFLATGFNDTTQPIDEAKAEYLAGAARALLAK